MKMIIAFAAGALLGSGLTYISVKEYFSQKAQADIDSVIEAFREKTEDESKEEATTIPIPTETNSIDMSKEYQIIMKDYHSVFTGKSKEDEMRERAASIPYVISPAEVNYDEYDSAEYIYYSDGVLADPSDDVVEDIQGLIGDALEHFGEYEEDTVLVNNDRLKLCIEITRDSRKYSDIVDENPHGGGD